LEEQQLWLFHQNARTNCVDRDGDRPPNANVLHCTKSNVPGVISISSDRRMRPLAESGSMRNFPGGIDLFLKFFRRMASISNLSRNSDFKALIISLFTTKGYGLFFVSIAGSAGVKKGSAGLAE